MKFVLVNKYDEIVTKVDLSDDIGVSGAKTYFKGVKQMSEDVDFDSLWRVMSEKEYDLQFKASLQNRQSDHRKYEWWKDDEEYLDIDK